MRLYRTIQGPAAEEEGRWVILTGEDWDDFVNDPALHSRLAHVAELLAGGAPGPPPAEAEWLAPIGAQEVWAAGVTYHRSRDARMEESQQSGGDDFYARVYQAPRPELFLKATPHRVVGHGQEVRIRCDSRWNVPEPELALFVNAAGNIAGYTIGNDMSSRDIEGENPLYLPQAKVYDACCGLGPGILVVDRPLPPETTIRLEIMRGDEAAFTGETTLARLKRSPEELVSYLFRDNSFPHGCFLLTGTGIVPPNSFSLQPGDEVRITIEPIGTLVNRVIQRPVAAEARRDAGGGEMQS